MGQKVHILQAAAAAGILYEDERKSKMVKKNLFVFSLFCLVGSSFALAGSNKCLTTYCSILNACMSAVDDCPGNIACSGRPDCAIDGGSKFVKPTGPTMVFNGKTYYRNSTGGYQETPPNTSVKK
jgi:hypothetical protein